MPEGCHPRARSSQQLTGAFARTVYWSATLVLRDDVCHARVALRNRPYFIVFSVFHPFPRLAQYRINGHDGGLELAREIVSTLLLYLKPDGYRPLDVQKVNHTYLIIISYFRRI